MIAQKKGCQTNKIKEKEVGKQKGVEAEHCVECGRSGSRMRGDCIYCRVISASVVIFAGRTEITSFHAGAICYTALLPRYEHRKLQKDKKKRKEPNGAWQQWNKLQLATSRRTRAKCRAYPATNTRQRVRNPLLAIEAAHIAAAAVNSSTFDLGWNGGRKIPGALSFIFFLFVIP